MDYRASTISWSVNCLLRNVFLAIILSYCSCHLFCSARDVIEQDAPVRDKGEPLVSAGDVIEQDAPVRDNGQTLVSAGGRFKLGFFTPNGSTDGRRYVGIWYACSPQTVVWVANRNNPLVNSTGVLFVVQHGNLHVLNGSTGKSLWSTGLNKSRSSNQRVKLMDSGNLVLRESSEYREIILWESFKNPTDTFLPDMEMDENLILTSWRKKDDPAYGDFTFKLEYREGEKQFITMNKSVPYWKSGGKFATSDKMRDVILSYYPNVTDTMLVLKFDGNITYQKWDEYQKAWVLICSEPRDRCSAFNVCGDYGSCSSKNWLKCKCLPGFKPRIPEKWDSGDFSAGCIKGDELCSQRDRFLGFKMRNMGDPDSNGFPAHNESECRKECFGNCQCQAYSFQEAKSSEQGENSSSNRSSCSIWLRDLQDLQEDYTDGGHNLSVRVALSDLGTRSRR